MPEASLEPDEAATAPAGEDPEPPAAAAVPRQVKAPPRDTDRPPRGTPKPAADAPAPAPASAPAPTTPPGITGRAVPLRREALWALAAAVSYGLTLFVGSEELVLLAIPGMLGLVVLEVLAVQYVLRRPARGSQAPYATDGTDRKGPVTYLYAALLKRYALLVVISLVIMAVPLVTRATYLIPLMGVGLLGIVLATVCWFDQLRWVRQCARVLNVYSFEFRTPVYQLDLWRNGRRFLVLGYEGLESPEMSAREPMGHPCWPDGIASGVWFAGDEVFGGALLVPGTGELMCLQPLDWDAFGEWRAAADDGRRAQAKRAGLDRHSV